MSILMYASAKESVSTRLREAATLLDEWVSIEWVDRLCDLEERLRETGSTIDILVLLVATLQDLRALVLLQNLTARFPVVIITRDGKPETTTLAHRLRPRYLTSVDSDLGNVAAVLRKMIENTSQTHVREIKTAMQKEQRRVG